MPIGKIESVAVIGDRKLAARWDDGERLTVDLSALIAERAALSPLRAEDEFARVRISPDGWSLEWPCGVDFGAPQLRRWAVEQTQDATAATPA